MTALATEARVDVMYVYITNGAGVRSGWLSEGGGGGECGDQLSWVVWWITECEGFRLEF